SKESLERACLETGLDVRSAAPRVFVVTSLVGGTGSGMFIDLAYLVRQQLMRLGHEAAEVVGICYLPPAASEPRRVQEQANTFAALTELNYFSSPNAVFSARYELGEVRRTDPLFSCKGPPLQRCQFYVLPSGRESAVSEENGVTVFAP